MAALSPETSGRGFSIETKVVMREYRRGTWNRGTSCRLIQGPRGSHGQAETAQLVSCAIPTPSAAAGNSRLLYLTPLPFYKNYTMAIEHAFNASVDYYDDWMMKALPNYQDIFQTAKELVFFDPSQPIDVIDLGAGTGLFSKHILDRFPTANFVLYDLADKMLDVARKRFATVPAQFSYRVGDYRSIDTCGAFDLAISSLSIHHLADADKRLLFQSVYRLLKRPGLFINIDQVRGTTSYLQDLYWNHWLTQVRQNGQSETRIQESIERRKYDREALLSDQLVVGVFLAMKQ